MATITTDTFLDTGTARLAGEAMSINGGHLRVRTDTRWHSDSPSGMSGTLGSVAISATLGGSYILDGTTVRWLRYTGGSGTVPAIGTNVRRTGVTSSYMLGVYASMTSAPSTPGAAMPSTGFIKFREVSGTFTAGALTGITATAAGPDVVGWIEVVMRHAAAITVPRLGQFRVRGDWFELDVTTGNANQVLQVPTNGGGADTSVPAVWIETGPGTGEYEAYPALLGALFNSTNLSTDVRSKFVQDIGNGQVRIGHDGTAACGFVPPAGCKVRIPNVIGRQCAVGADSTNSAPHVTIATRPDFVTTLAGNLDVENFMTDWYFSATNAYSVKLKNTAAQDAIVISNAASPLAIDNIVVSPYLGTTVGLTATACTSGGDISNSKFIRGVGASAGYALSFVTSANFTGNNNTALMITKVHSGSRPINLTECSNFTMYNTNVLNGGVRIATSTNIRFYDLDYCDVLVGTTTAPLPRYVVETLASCNDVVIDRVTFGQKGQVSGVSPYTGLFYSLGSSTITFKNAGTPQAPLDCEPTAAPGYILVDAGANTTLKAARCFVTATRTGLWNAVATTMGLKIDNLHGTVGSLILVGCDMEARGNRGTSFSTSAGAAVYGTHCQDAFLGDTSGGIVFSFNEPTASSYDRYNFSFELGENAGYTSGNQLSLPNVGDTVVLETPEFIVGHTGFANINPVVTGTSTTNLALSYDIDSGAGFTGTFKPLTAANLSSESFTPTKGVRVRLKVEATSAVATTAITHVRLLTETSLAAQQANLYSLGRSVTLSLSGLVPGSEVVVFDPSDGELDRKVVDGESYAYHYLKEVEDPPAPGYYLIVWHPDYRTRVFRNITLYASDQNIDITQERDYLYDGDTIAKSTFATSGSPVQVINHGVTSVTVRELYSDWKRWVREDSNAQHLVAFAPIGGDPITDTIRVPYYARLENGWRIRPHEANHTLSITGGGLIADGDPIADTLSNFRVRINYQQPVQALTVGALTSQDVRDAFSLSSSTPPEPGSVDATLKTISAHTSLIPSLI